MFRRRPDPEELAQHRAAHGTRPVHLPPKRAKPRLVMVKVCLAMARGYGKAL
jgi:hypothetical protein